MIQKKPYLMGLEAIPDDQKAALHKWLLENLEYKDIRARMLEVFGRKTSCTALCDYRKRHAKELLAGDGESLGESAITIEICAPANVAVRIVTKGCKAMEGAAQ